MNKKVFKLIALILSLSAFVSLFSINAAAYIYYPTDFDASVWDRYGLYVEDIANNLNNLGDANLDNKISIADAKLILRTCAKLAKLDEKETFAADVNQDGKVSVADAKQVLRVVAGIDWFKVNVNLEVGQEYVTDPVFSVGGLLWTCNISPETGLDMERYIDTLPEEDDPFLGVTPAETFKFTAKAPGTYEVILKLEQPDKEYMSITYIFTVK